jgi:CubicO group peptidase (beta-lactamase class C family)
MMTKKQLDSFLRRSIKRYGVPGASFAVMRNGKLLNQSQAGLVNVETGVKVTPDAVFQIGSITKPMTTTLVMQMVDEGLVELDSTVESYLPQWNRASTVTLRQLMSHTSGVEGDFIIDSGRGEDAIRRYVDKCTMVPSIFAPGEMMSYCNLGYAVLARLIEVVRGKPFDEVLMERLFEPLMMEHSFASPEHAIRFNCAVGHEQNQQNPGQSFVASPLYLPHGQTGAGTLVSMSAPDLLRFAQLHLDRGKTQDNRQILSRSSVREMQRVEIKTPKYTRFGIKGWGLGWSLMKWGEHTVYGHTGATVGQFTFLCVIPRQHLAFALLTNGGGFGATSLFEEVCNKVIMPMAGTSPPALPEVSATQPEQLDVYSGHYELTWVRIELTPANGTLCMEIRDLRSGLIVRESTPLVFIDRNTARVNTGDAELDRETLIFSGWSQRQKPEFVQIDLRQLRRRD